MTRFGILGLLALVLVIGTIGWMGYEVGLSAATTTQTAADGTAATYVHGPGFWPFALLIGVVVVSLVIGLLARLAIGPWAYVAGKPWGGHGHHGFGRWSDPEQAEVPPPFRPMLERWHREAHRHAAGAGEPPVPGGPPPSPAGPTTPGGWPPPPPPTTGGPTMPGGWVPPPTGGPR